MPNKNVTRVDCFIGENQVRSLVMSEPVEIMPGVMLTVINESGDTLVEITDHARKVRVGERQAIDVVQLRSGEAFLIDDTECFLLRPYETQVSQKTSGGFELPPTPMKKTEPHVEYTLTSFLPAVSGLFLIVGFCVLFGGESQTEQAFAWPKFPTYSEQNAQAAVQPFDDQANKAEEPAELGPEPSDMKAPAKLANKEAKKAKPKPQRRAAKAGKALWNEYQEYTLERKFDPRSANRKLRDLRIRSPRGSKLRRTISSDLGI